MIRTKPNFKWMFVNIFPMKMLQSLQKHYLFHLLIQEIITRAPVLALKRKLSKDNAWSHEGSKSHKFVEPKRTVTDDLARNLTTWAPDFISFVNLLLLHSYVTVMFIHPINSFSCHIIVWCILKRCKRPGEVHCQLSVKLSCSIMHLPSYYSIIPGPI